MRKSRSPLIHREELQNEMESNFMAAPNVSLSTSYHPVWQTQDYVLLRTSDETMYNPVSAADLDFSWLMDAKQQLQEVHKEVTETCTLDDEIDPVPSSVYYDAFWLLQLLDNYNVPMPDIGWLIDGGIGFEWRSADGKGIGTMSIYGDNKVIYGASLGDKRRVKGTCVLNDSVLLIRFLPMLKTLCSQ